MVDYPLVFETSSELEKGQRSWKSGNGTDVDVSIPPEFGGDEESLSPEEMYCLAIENCVVATFKTIAERKDLQYENISSNAKIVLDRDQDSRPMIKTADIHIEAYNVSDLSKARKIREATLNNCFIHKSVKTEIETEFEFREAD